MNTTRLTTTYLKEKGFKKTIQTDSWITWKKDNIIIDSNCYVNGGGFTHLGKNINFKKELDNLLL